MFYKNDTQREGEGKKRREGDREGGGREGERRERCNADMVEWGVIIEGRRVTTVGVGGL
jgi:hypothetical protein